MLVTYHTVATAEPITATIPQNVQILAAGQKFQPDPEGKAASVDVVTLLVKPDDAERVVLASSQGMVHFVLRNGTDKDNSKQPAVQLSQLEGGAPPRPAPVTPIVHPAKSAPVPNSYVVETVNGGKQTLESFK